MMQCVKCTNVVLLYRLYVKHIYKNQNHLYNDLCLIILQIHTKLVLSYTECILETDIILK